jgi:hypothetical protein
LVIPNCGAPPVAEKLRVLEKLRKQAISIAENRRELLGKSDLSLRMSGQCALHCFTEYAKI